MGAAYTVTSADGTAIACEACGTGPPVILVGGAFNVRQSTAALAARLAPRFTAVSYDRRGRGRSGDTAPYAAQREIEDLAAVIEAAGRPACIYGLSSGAVLALEAAAAGLAISRLALFEPPYRLGDSPRLPEDFIARLTELTSSGRPGEAVEHFMTAALGLPAGTVAWMRRGASWPTFEATAPTVVYDSIIIGDGSLPASRLAAITQPALVIDSTGSPPWMRRVSRAVAGALADARHRSLAGGFHNLSAEALAPVLKSFFAA